MAYSTTNDIAGCVGAGNRDIWADRDNDGSSSTITASINAAITQADAIIDGFFRDGPYVTPFSPVPQLVLKWSARLAAVELYRARGLRDTDDDVAGKLSELEKLVWEEMDLYVSGTVRLQEAVAHGGPTAPAVVRRG